MLEVYQPEFIGALRSSRRSQSRGRGLAPGTPTNQATNLVEIINNKKSTGARSQPFRVAAHGRFIRGCSSASPLCLEYLMAELRSHLLTNIPKLRERGNIAYGLFDYVGNVQCELRTQQMVIAAVSRLNSPTQNSGLRG